MSYLLANGCSYTDENFGANSGDYIHTNEEKDKLGIPRGNWKMWPEYVAERMDLLHLNLGSSGGSNYRMYSTSTEQICRQKPKILMHLWTGSDRHQWYDRNYHTYNYATAAFFAAELMNHNGHIFLEHAKSGWFNRANARYAFQAIKLFYPEKLEETFQFYTSFHSDDEWILELLSHCRKNVVDINNLPEQRNTSNYVQAALMKLWIHYTNFFSDYNSLRCHEMADSLISKELEPILQTYYVAEAENIPFVSMFAQHISPHTMNISVSKKLKQYEDVIKATVKIDRKSYNKGNSARKFIDAINTSNLNRFEIIILFYEYVHRIANENAINNPLFMKLDNLIDEKKIITKGWPPFAYYGVDPEKCISEKWEHLSKMDLHPSPNTQKHIGDAFYDLYQENYS